ncbi:MAG: sugar phosphate isomerase/epimerase [Chloroflexi bacterium]|nr:MAG: sugar phosphate isomerase/epimerase [Chloroflexota bacterium]
MKLGLMTAALGSMELEDLADWASAEGFQALEIASWPRVTGDRRRYAGVSHLDVDGLDKAGAAALRKHLDERGLEISSLAYYPNNLDPDQTVRAEANEHLRKVIVAAELLGVTLVGTFIGRDQGRSVTDNLAEVEKVWPDLVRFAGRHGVTIVIENCPMIFSGDEWPGGKNLAYSPAIWRRLFEIVDADNFGLNLDPSHLVWQFIDYERAVREFGSRIHHVHAKDMEIDRDGLFENGVMSAGMGWQIPRLPGLGEIRWDRFVAALYGVGYRGTISIEHEDRSFEGDEDLVKRGFLLARDVLRPLIV